MIKYEFPCYPGDEVGTSTYLLQKLGTRPHLRDNKGIHT